MVNLTWTMNCILVGAKIHKLIKEGKEKEAMEKLNTLTSKIGKEKAKYIINRIKRIRKSSQLKLE